MQNAPTIEMPEEEARALYQDYAEEIKERGDNAEKYLKELKSTYYHLSQGRKVLDIYEVFKKSSLKQNGDPELAIARADLKKIFFRKQAMGSGLFTAQERWGESAHDVALPTGTFPAWKMEVPGENATEWEKNHPQIERSVLQTKVPLVPAHIMPNGKLDNYYILFEVVEWNEVPVAADPYLLKRINSNAFVVLAEWDITPVEQAILRG